MSKAKWKKHLTLLEEELAANPNEIELAKKVWRAYAEGPYNIQSGVKAISVFCSCALNDINGMIALAEAFKELFELTGELPKKELFEEGFLEKLNSNCMNLSDTSNDAIAWLCRKIEG